MKQLTANSVAPHDDSPQHPGVLTHPPHDFVGTGTARSAVEGSFAVKVPSTSLRLVPLPGKGRGGQQK